MLWHFPAPQVFTGTPQLWTDHRLFPAPPGGESGRDFSRIFSDPGVCIWDPVAGRGQLPAKEHSPAPGEGLQGCIHFLWGEQPLPSAFRGLQGNVAGLKSVLLLWSGRAGALSRSAAGTAAPGEMGLALHSCTWVHADLGELLAMLSQPPVMQDLAELVFLGGQGRLQTKARGVPWGQCPGCSPASCLQSLLPSKVTARLKPWGSYSVNTCSVCVEHFKVS